MRSCGSPVGSGARVATCNYDDVTNTVQSPPQSSAPGDRLQRPPERGHYLDKRCDVSERTCAPAFGGTQ